MAPALSPLTEGAGGAGSAGTGQGIGAAIQNAVEGAKEYLPPQVYPSTRFFLPLACSVLIEVP